MVAELKELSACVAPSFYSSLFSKPAETCTLLLGSLFQQFHAAPPVVMPNSGQDAIEQTHGRGVGGAKRWGLHRGNKALVGKASDRGNQRVRYADAISPVGACLTQTFHSLAQAAAETHGNQQVTFARRTGQVSRLTGRCCSHHRKSQQN